MKNKSYIGTAFIILVFGIYFVPKIIDRIKNNDIVKGDRLNIEGTHVANKKRFDDNRQSASFFLNKPRQTNNF